jgi:hypothetical protein
MASIGVEYIDYFADARANAGISGAEDLSAPYYIGAWFGPTLQGGGHELRVEHAEKGVLERHMRDVSKGGIDRQVADGVDMFLICTHGDYTNGECLLLYDTNADAWIGHSKDWQFGDTCNLEWLLIYGCQTIDGDNILDHHHVFHGLHLICGAFSYMYDSFTIDECGQDTANNLLSGKAVSDAWLDGVSDWWVSNHPMVISVETFETYNGGNPDWGSTVLSSDHLWGTGITRADILPQKQYWMANVWSDGGIYDGWP